MASQLFRCSIKASRLSGRFHEDDLQCPYWHIIYGEGRTSNLASPTPSLAGCSLEPPWSFRALGKSLRELRGLGLPREPYGHQHRAQGLWIKRLQ